jgi:hypothetical protein
MGKFSMKKMGKEVGPASTYAAPHTMDGKPGVAMRPKAPITRKANWTPLDGVSIGINDEVKTSGIKMRGTGAATKGVMSRGPMG